jgi:hypothetical protein
MRYGFIRRLQLSHINTPRRKNKHSTDFAKFEGGGLH